MRTTWAWFRVDAARRWRSLLVLALLVAVSAGTVATAFAGARRGASALERLAERTTPATIVLQPFGIGFDWAKVRALPQVETFTTYAETDFALEGVPDDGLVVAGIPEDTVLGTAIERPVVLDGRYADQARADEVMVTSRFVDSYGKGVGDTVTALLPTPEARRRDDLTSAGVQAGTIRVPLRIVGVVRSPWFDDGPQSTGTVVPTVGFGRQYRANLVAPTTWSSGLIRLKGGTAAVPSFRADLVRATGRTDLDVRVLAEQLERRQHSASFEARSLGAFGVVALLAAVVLVGQALVRYVGSAIADLRVLRALGLTRRHSVLAALAGPLVAAVGGGTLGVVAAAVASRWFPIGSAAQAEPSPGVRVDLPVLAGVWLLAVLLVVATSAAVARVAVGSGAGQRRHPSPVAAAAARAGLPVPVVIGTRFAFDRGRGPTALPTRPALAGAVAGVLGVAAVLTFSAGVADAADNPARFGQTWQLETWMGFAGQDLVPERLSDVVARDPDVTGILEWHASIATDTRRQVNLEMYALLPHSGTVPPVLVRGRMPATATELTLAPETAHRMDAGVGDTVVLRGTRAAARQFTVVGIGFVPAGSRCSLCSEASGAWLTRDGFSGLFESFQFHVGLIALRPGADVDAAVARLDRTGSALGSPAQFVRPFPPFAAADLQRVRTLPFALAGFLALLALGTVGHALSTAVRRRRHELAVLRALGMTRRQAREVVVTQATLLALVGLAFGVPLGRTVWRVVADYTPIFYAPPSALGALLLAVPVTLLAAILLAAWPGRRAARLRIGELLRAE